MAWSVLQSAGGTSSAGVTSFGVAYSTANLSAGTKLIAAVSVSAGGGGTTSTVKDGAGNSFTKLLAQATGAVAETSLWAIDVPAGDVGSKPTITATISSGNGVFGIVVQEVSGLATGSTLAAMIDGTPGGVAGNNNTGSGSSPTYSSTAANEYMVALYGDDGGPLTWTKPAALTADPSSVNSNSNTDTAIAYGNSTGGAETATWSLTGTATPWATILAAFKLAPASGGTVAPARPGQTWLRRFHHRQQLLLPAAVAAGVTSGPPVYPLGHPVQARQLPQRGGSIIIRTGVFGQTGPPVRNPSAPVKAQPAVPFLKGRISSRSGLFAGTGAAVIPPRKPVASVSRGLPQRGRIIARAGAYGNLGPPLTPPRVPVTIHRALPPAGHAVSHAGTLGVLGPPVRQPHGPVRIVPQPPPRGRILARAGTFTSTVITSGPTVYPWRGPVRTRPQPPPRGRIVKAAGTFSGTGPAVKPPQQPVSAARRPLPSRGRTASLRGPYGQAGPPVVRPRSPVRGQPQKPLLTGRVTRRAGTYTSVAPPPAVTVNAASAPAVTAQDTSASAVQPRSASSAAVTGPAGSARAAPRTGSTPAATQPGTSTPAVSDG